jgi:hypothetical protein
MNSITIPNELSFAVEEVCKISVECWRLGRIAELWSDSTEAAGLRHAARHIAEALSAVGMEILDFSGRPYDPGLVPEELSPNLGDGRDQAAAA